MFSPLFTSNPLLKCSGSFVSGITCIDDKIVNPNGTPNYSKDYIYYNNLDHYGSDIGNACLENITPDQCKLMCDQNPLCKAFNLWTPLSRKGCCLKTSGIITGPNLTCDFYVKKIQ